MFIYFFFEMLTKDKYLRSRSRKECCCGTRLYAVRDFEFVYKQVEAVNLPPQHKNLLLARYVHIMEKIKHQFGCFSAWFTCSKTSLIVGNITIPSVMSIQALMNDDATARQVLFWIVWALSVVIAIISSIMTFCSTQKKYNLFNQFNTKVQRELWAYLTLTGRYRIRMKHKRAIEQFQTMERQKKRQREERQQARFVFDDGPAAAEDRGQNQGPESKQQTEGAQIDDHESVISDSDIDFMLSELFAEDDADFLDFGGIPDKSPAEVGHKLMFTLFMNRLETLYRHLTNSNIDIELEDVNPVGDESENETDVSGIQGVRRPRLPTAPKIPT